MKEERQALLLLGGDLGDVRRTLYLATQALAAEAGVLLAQSRDHWTLPWGFSGQGLFLNKAILLRTALAPHPLLELALRIEERLGRTRDLAPGYHSRMVDIDLLLLDNMVLEHPTLTVPHPRMHLRAFALAPAADIAPAAMHPLLERSVLELLSDLRASTT